jgi:hypothetical protein
MATNNTNKCKTCGCDDSFMVSPAPCPTPIGCPTPQPCSEIFDAQCVRYTGANILCDTDIVVNSNDTVAEALEGIVDYVCNTSYTYEIGQYVPSRGGVIAHRWLSGTTQNYLVLSVSVIADNKRWATVNVSIPNVTSNWDGKTNTNNLVAAGIPSGIGVDEAASICNTYVDPLSSNTDWYLPSVDELSKVWQNRFDITIGLLAAGSVLATSGELYGDFWSSTQYVSFLSAGNAFRFDFSTGYPSSLAKTSQRSVLAVRKFSL